VRVALVSLFVLLVAVGASAGATPRLDRAIVARDILPPGNYGGVDFQKTSQDQAPMYDALTAKFSAVTARDLQTDFKAEPLWTGKEKVARVEHPGRGVRILRDSFDVPHVFGKTEANVFYGVGYAAAEDRGVLMELARGPGRLACLDAPGYNAFAVALSGKQFKASPQAEAFLAKQIAWLQHGGAQGRQELKDIDAYVAGINAQRTAANLPITPWTRNDVVAATCLLGARFGAGGGDETRRSELYDALVKRLGGHDGLLTYQDLSELNDPDAPTTLAKAFPFGPPLEGAPDAANAMVDDASAQPAADHGSMSNAVLVSAKRSSTGHPLMVAGPQLGYFYPEFFWEVDMEGGGVHVRGGSLAGIPNVLIGRGPGYGWSFTSANSDNIDTFAETLCGGDDHHYLYKGQCLAMARFDAGTIIYQGTTTAVSFYETVHGPVFGYGTVHGTRVALAEDRSTRGRELNAALDVYALSTGRMTSAKQFVHDLSRFEMVFNGFYLDGKDIAYVSCGRLPVRAPGVDPAFPTAGTGDDDWRGFLAPAKHPWAIDPGSGEIVNWNNKPAPKFAAADDKWSYGSIYRVQLLERGVKRGKNSPLDLVRAMNTAATQDLRAVLVWPDVDAILAKTPAPSAQDEQVRETIDAWVKTGASRLDRDLDGKIDDPGAALLDTAWPHIADAVMSPVLGPLTDRLAELIGRDQAPSPQGSAYEDGWYGYVDKDLKTLAGTPVKLKFHERYCGHGDATACSQSLWAALDAAVPAIGTRSDAVKERIQFAPGFLPVTMRWTNRPTYQQILSFR
jgi:acyl-homoserine lactone acylase PvdQ